MKIYVIAIALMVFSGMVGIYNDLGIFGDKSYNPKLTNVSESEVTEIFKPSSNGEVSTGIISDIMGVPGMIYKVMSMAWKLLGNAFNLGGVFSQYVPGVVGQQIGILITTLTWVVYAWGGIQLWQKVSSKSMD